MAVNGLSKRAFLGWHWDRPAWTMPCGGWGVLCTRCLWGRATWLDGGLVSSFYGGWPDFQGTLVLKSSPHALAGRFSAIRKVRVHRNSSRIFLSTRPFCCGVHGSVYFPWARTLVSISLYSRPVNLPALSDRMRLTESPTFSTPYPRPLTLWQMNFSEVGSGRRVCVWQVYTKHALVQSFTMISATRWSSHVGSEIDLVSMKILWKGLVNVSPACSTCSRSWNQAPTTFVGKDMKLTPIKTFIIEVTNKIYNCIFNSDSFG